MQPDPTSKVLGFGVTAKPKALGSGVAVRRT